MTYTTQTYKRFRLMVGQMVSEQKNVSLLRQKYGQQRKYKLGRTFFFLDCTFLSLIFGQEDCLASLRSADNCPPSLRSRKEKSNLGKKCSSLFVFLYRPYYVTRTEYIFFLMSLSLECKQVSNLSSYLFTVRTDRANHLPLTVSLTVKTRPKWARQVRELTT